MLKPLKYCIHNPTTLKPNPENLEKTYRHPSMRKTFKQSGTLDSLTQTSKKKAYLKYMELQSSLELLTTTTQVITVRAFKPLLTMNSA